jgi:hypothetical protein
LVEASVEGTPQGGPLSPLLANIYLDVLDKELERRGHRYCRYADDCNIYVGSQLAAERTLASIQDWIEKHLRLKVNAAKSGTGRVWERKFLGFQLDRGKRIGIAPESLARFKAKVREMWRGNQSGTSQELRDAWQRYVRGWWGFFRLAEVRKQDLSTGGMDSAAYPEMLLDSVAQRCRTGACARRAGGSSPGAQNSADGPRGLVHGSYNDHECGAEGPNAASLWLPYAIRSCSHVRAAGLNRRMRKTSRPAVWEGGGASIPVTRPDQSLQQCAPQTRLCRRCA